ncbi:MULTISPECIES: hypothetical protein [unclassified Streptomyces]|uniref:Uncharacterized protein n=1 Tax=Streptomyces millisiae TaxID=3075542 RepID=A0ABU2LT31_9ACTN|nr:hypothetical protein [Streptomyces sp. DSM 44918]MDT0320218.1 hypothetical protein [Streptomyces sp. DSM 44918]
MAATTTAERLRDAESAAEELRQALETLGVVLPSLRVDLASCTAEANRPLVDLGCCNLAMVRKLASVLRGCA